MLSNVLAYSSSLGSRYLEAECLTSHFSFILSSLGSRYLEAECLTSRFSFILSSLGSRYLEAECLTLRFSLFCLPWVADTWKRNVF